MTNEVTRTADKYDSREMIEVLKQTVAKGATDAQLKMFVEVCRSTGLNPFLKEIWYVADKGMIMAGRDGYLRVANENPQFDGMETKVERDEKGVPIKATCSVWRKDRSHAITCEAYYSEYKKSGPVWSQYPSAMIGKVAEVLALKRSFTINGTVTEEEMGEQGGSREAAQAVAQAKIAAGSTKAYDATRTIEAPAAELGPALSREEKLHNDIYDASVGKKLRKPFDKFAILQAIQPLKKRFIALDREDAYRATLKRCGVEKSNQFTDDQDGLMARVCYKELSLIIDELEHQAKADEPLLVTKLPDPVEQIAGLKLRFEGIVWEVRDNGTTHEWVPIPPV